MKVSIIITAYNVEQFIARAVNSALAQDYKDVEVVVVNDCSTDKTTEILESYGDKIKLITHEVNQGAGIARRNGIQASTGDFAITLDADDWMDSDLISNLVKKQEETGADIVSGGVIVEHPDGAWDAHCYSDKNITTPKERLMSFFKEKVKFMNNKLIARHLHESVVYSERRFIEDTPTIIPMLYLAKTFAYASTVGYHYLNNSQSLTHTASQFKWALFGACAALDIIKFFEAQDYHELDQDMAQDLLRNVTAIRQLQPSEEEVAQYQKEWNYYTTEVNKRVK